MDPYSYELLMQQDMMNAQMQLMNQSQQQMMAMQQNHTPGVRKTTRKDVITYLQNKSCASEIVLVNDFETQRARHICKGGKDIYVLEKGIEQVPTSFGYISVEYFLCPVCKKLILNKQTLVF